MFEISHSILFLCVYCRKQVCGVHCGFVGGRCEGILIYIQPAKANLCKAESPFWMNSVMLSFDLTILRNEYNVILTFFWHSRIEPREQEVWSVVRISIGQNSKQCEAMLTLAWLCESKCTASRGRGSPWQPPPPLMPLRSFSLPQKSAGCDYRDLPNDLRSQVSGAKSL